MWDGNCIIAWAVSLMWWNLNQSLYCRIAVSFSWVSTVYQKRKKSSFRFCSILMSFFTRTVHLDGSQKYTLGSESQCRKLFFFFFSVDFLYRLKGAFESSVNLKWKPPHSKVKLFGDSRAIVWCWNNIPDYSDVLLNVFTSTLSLLLQFCKAGTFLMSFNSKAVLAQF